MKYFIFPMLFATLITINVANGATYKEIVIPEGYDHTLYSPECTDDEHFEKKLAAYTTCFDLRSAGSKPMGIPRYVSYHMKEHPGALGKAPKRPPWFTEKTLFDRGLAPSDATYRYSRAFRSQNPNWYVRGHLAMKYHAFRISKEADWNTHTLLNAVPQRAQFNSTIWLDMEKNTAKWADMHGEVWILTGPIFNIKPPTAWIGEPRKGEVLAAAPDALFKIVVKEIENKLDVLAFIYPQEHRSYSNSSYNHAQWLVSVDEIEKQTGLDFFPNIDDAQEEELEKTTATAIWPTEKMTKEAQPN